MSSQNINFPEQTLPYRRKTKEWRKRHLEWANSKTFFNYSLVRKSVIHKKINYDLLNGILHMSDIEVILNPNAVQATYIPEKIQHYPIMLSKLNVLRGEELRRVFDIKVIITNPNSISEIEETKKKVLTQDLQDAIKNSSSSEDEYNQKLQQLQYYYNYEYQDYREIRANSLLHHYIKEYNIPIIFNDGFMDALTVAEEIYKCDIIGGEPTIYKLNPLKVRIFKSGYSSKIEDADVILIEDYWQPGKIIDTYYDVLSKKDIDYIESIPDHLGQASTDSMNNIDERYGYVNANMVGEEMSTNGFYFNPFDLFSDNISNSLLPYDLTGNIRVLQLYWKSKRKVKKVKSYDPISGEETFNFYPEDYTIDTYKGEEETSLYINEAWEATQIGSDIFINMRPRIIQYNRLSNPSKCHFGIIGTIYNLNESRPYSMVDIMKPYNYMYDVIHDRLNEAIASNWGKILEVDLAQIPKGWEMDKWMYYAKRHHIAIKDSFKEGNIGAATGKLAGGFASNSRGTIDAETGNYIQQLINLLEFIKMEMAEVAGISKQREGQISNRETVGGVERANLQSSHITEWLFSKHEDTKKRVLECFLETAKIALKGRSKKFQYILSNGSMKLMDIDGDEFSESDYGLVVDSSNTTQELNNKLDSLAQAALQNQALSFSSIMKLYSSCSIIEKQRIIEKDEQNIQERNSKNQQLQIQSNEKIEQSKLDFEDKKLQLEDSINARDNETKLLIAEMQRYANIETSEDVEISEESRKNLEEKIREFDEKIKLDKESLNFEKKKHKDTINLKNKK